MPNFARAIPCDEQHAQGDLEQTTRDGQGQPHAASITASISRPARYLYAERSWSA